MRQFIARPRCQLRSNAQTQLNVTKDNNSVKVYYVIIPNDSVTEVRIHSTLYFATFYLDQ